MKRGRPYTLTDTRYISPDGAILNSHGYALDMGNQRTQQTRKGPGYTNTVDYGYDPLGQVLSAVGKEVDGSTRLHEKFGYKYDAAGNLGARTNNALVQNFAVNEVNQLTNVTRTGGSTLTVSGNTSSKATNVTVNGQTASRYADLLFAKDGFTLANGSNTFTAIAQNMSGMFNTNSIAVNLPATSPMTFDANGNMTWDGAKAFEYDDENQLVRVTQTNVFKSEFVYDGLGRMRVKREYDWSSGVWVLGTETRYIYDGMLVIQERGANGYPQVSYTRGKDLSGGMQGAGGIGGLLARTDHTQTSALLKTAFYHTDGNGNITALLSTNGLVVAWYQYSPFGTTLAQSGPLADANVYRFSSKAWHERTGLYYYGYRFYSPNLQRWLNADPIQEAGGINLYGFVGNNPLSSIDPFGESTMTAPCEFIDPAKGGQLAAAAAAAAAAAKAAAAGITAAGVGEGVMIVGAVVAAPVVLGAAYIFIETLNTVPPSPVIYPGTGGNAIPISITGAGTMLTYPIAQPMPFTLTYPIANPFPIWCESRGSGGGERGIGNNPKPSKKWRPYDKANPSKGGERKDPQDGKWRPAPMPPDWIPKPR